MIEAMDEALRQLLLEASGEVDPEGQIGFQRPDAAWRDRVEEVGRPCLNAYLFDVRESVGLRTGEPPRRRQGGSDFQRRYLECRYLVSAWAPSGSTDSGATNEHRLLTASARAIFSRTNLSLASAGSQENPQESEASMRIDESVGFEDLGRFWSGMDSGGWRPALCLVVTLPVEWSRPVTESLVTEHQVSFRHQHEASGAETRSHIGGVVQDRGSDPPAPIADAIVNLETQDGMPLRTARTDAEGRFRINDLSPGRYRLRWSAPGHGEPASKEVEIPTSTEELSLPLG